MKNVSSGMIVALGLVLQAGTGWASVRDLQWYKTNSGASGVLYHISGSSLDRLFAGPASDTDIRQYNRMTGSWDVVQGWRDHLDGNTNWSSITSISGVAAYGDEVYVVADPYYNHNWVGYSSDGGTTWQDVDKGVTLAAPSIVFDGSLALVANSQGTMTVLDGATATTTANAGGITAGTKNVGASIGGDGSMWFVAGGNLVGRNPSDGSGWANATGTGLDHSGSPYAYGIHAIDEDTAFLTAGNLHHVYQTTNGGQTWVNIGDIHNDPLGTNELQYPGGHTRGLYADSADSVWAYGSYSKFFHYDGSTWRGISLPDHVDPLMGMTKVEGHYFVFGFDGTIYTTIPEPSTLSMLGSLGILLALWRRKDEGRRSQQR